MSTAAPETQTRSAAMTPAGERPWRVLFFDHTSQLGGGEIALSDLIRHFDPAWVTPLVALAGEGPFADRLRREGVEVHVLPLAAEVLHARRERLGAAAVAQGHAALRALQYVWRFARFLRRERIDLLHTNSLKADVLGGLAGRLARVPVVWHIRDRIAEDYLPRNMVRTMRTLARVLPRYVIANSAASLATVQLNGKRPGVAIPSAVDLSAFDGPATQEGGEEAAGVKRIGLVGRICPWKGQHVFIEAAREVYAQFPAARFQIIGAALFEEHDYEAEIRRMTQEYGLSSVIEFTGFRHDVHALIKKLDVVAHASITGEPFGQVIVQGMAAGKPVVATNGGGVPEIVVDGVTGLLVPMGDAHALAEALLRVLRDPAMAAEMGRRGRERARERFSIEQTARQVEAVYAAVLGGRASRKANAQGLSA